MRRVGVFRAQEEKMRSMAHSSYSYWNPNREQIIYGAMFGGVFAVVATIVIFGSWLFASIDTPVGDATSINTRAQIEFLIAAVVSGVVGWPIYTHWRTGRAAGTDRRQPWFAYGYLAILGAMLLLSTTSVTRPPASERPPATLVVVSLLFWGGAFGCLVGVLDKLVIHRGWSVRKHPLILKTASLVFAGWLLLTSGSGFWSFIAGSLHSDYTATQGQSFMDAHGQYVIEAPAAWVEYAPFREQNSAIGLWRPDADLYFSLELIDKTDVDKDLHEFGRICAAHISSHFDNPDVSNWQRVQINGHTAIQAELLGASENVWIKMLITCIEATDHLCCVRAWAAPSQFQAHRPEIEAILASLHEADASDPIGPRR
jgi:hypothetical protein